MTARATLLKTMLRRSFKRAASTSVVRLKSITDDSADSFFEHFDKHFPLDDASPSLLDDNDDDTFASLLQV
ncbi:hypothetical protein SDRG_08281 [Saprolegnia diclina VS20]|uniref:Uncharacterized protein n=1 Tax=Saprolegnia diclina (strain VS20) TaxID=1156394 RepID=T0RNV9_SAPDV|nr:hypothetical protein SDRG_08281 [Saprolegnia diclina VS20]EQC34068.1 hypothetical protein SDRG_08281 [Saprolegnia diclina VS20]|eukprot:XP_008612380.1 hypothetical protein SDRG_08281 [Saprolegnia diclina VS20]